MMNRVTSYKKLSKGLEKTETIEARREAKTKGERVRVETKTHSCSESMGIDSYNDISNIFQLVC